MGKTERKRDGKFSNDDSRYTTIETADKSAAVLSFDFDVWRQTQARNSQKDCRGKESFGGSD